MPDWILPTGVGIIVSVIGYLLAAKDNAQEKQITALWEVHNADASRLANLELHVAKEHYIKPELDAKFAHLEIAFRDGFHELGNKFDKLSDRLLERRP